MVFIIRSVQDEAVGLSAAGIRAEENKDENARDGAAMNWLWVAMGGAIGASLRYGIGLWLFKPQMQFPWPTWWVNILGCLCTGIFLAYSQKYPALQQEARLFLMVGLLGGFTTFSSFGLESFQLLKQGAISMALLYMFSSLLLGLTALTVGFYLSDLMLNQT